MPKPGILLFLAIALSFCSSKTENKYSNAIKDFRNSLQPHIVRIVSKGVVMPYDNTLRKFATNKELIQLSESEHPILRASAFREILKRSSFNHFDMLMKHLDDTALVDTDAGEFGIWTRAVSDDILMEAAWDTEKEKSKTVERVLTKHNYLRSAYIILLSLEPEDKYYSFIKEMATRPRRLSPEGYELGFGDIEYALYGLAKFRKKDDVKIIKEQMMDNAWKLSTVSFRLLKEFPDTSYFDVLQKYHRRQFYKFSGNRPGGFSGVVEDRAAPEDFIQALVLQHSSRSANLLDTMLNRIPMQTCMPDKGSIIDDIVMAIWNNPCPAYVRLREKIKPKAEEILKWQVYLPAGSSFDMQVDSVKRKFYWYY